METKESVESKLIFIDIDGTLTGSLNGEQAIPESANLEDM